MIATVTHVWTAALRRLAAASAILLALAALTGCTNGVAAPGAPTADAANAATARIGLLLPDSVTARYEAADRPFFQNRIRALCPRCTVLYANADGDAAKQQQQAESMLTQGVSVLVLDPFDSEAAAAIVGEAAAKKVAVIAYDRLIDSDQSDYYISFDNEKVGRLQAQALVDKLRADRVPAGSGILMVNGSPTDNNATLFKKGAHSVIDASGYRVLAEYDTPAWEPSKAQDWVAGQITQYGTRIRGVYAANDSIGGGAIASLKAADVSPLPPVTGQDAELAGIQRILTGDQYMTVYKAIEPEAQKAADLAIHLTRGERPKGETTVHLTAGGAVPSFLLTPVAVTAANIEGTVVKDAFYGPGTVSKICVRPYAAACAKYGIR